MRWTRSGNFAAISRAGSSVPESAVRQPYSFGAPVRSIFLRNPLLRKRFQIALPELSGPNARKNVALTPNRRNVSSSRGTPSRIPSCVSTSTLRL